MALQKHQGPPPLLVRPIATETQVEEHSQSHRHHRTTSPDPLEQSDGGSSSSHPHTREQHDQTQRKIEELVCIQDLNKFIQERVEEAKMQHHDRLRAITIDTSNSPFSESIFECEFLKKFTIPTFDCYSGQSDPIHISVSIRTRW